MPLALPIFLAPRRSLHFTSAPLRINLPNQIVLLTFLCWDCSGWRQEQQRRTEERAKASREEHDKVRAAARADIDKFMEERRQRKEQLSKEHRATQEHHVKQAVTPSTDNESWSR